MAHRHLLVMVVLAAVCGCGSNSKEAARTPGSDRGSFQPAPLAGETIAPGRCRIVATVVSVEPRMAEGSGPCAAAPCRATVRVDSILGYGSAFAGILAVGTTITPDFTYTLAPTTRELFPTMSLHLPGLVEGSQFMTDIEARSELGDKRGAAQYVVFGYVKIR